MGEQQNSFVRHGTKDERIEVSADDILDAVAEGKDIDIKHASIDGELNAMMISDQLKEDEDGSWCIKGSIKIEESEIHSDVDFSLITFDGDLSFLSSVFDGEVAFSSVTFNREVDFSSVIFREKVNFSSAAFNEKANFSTAIFNESAGILSATFSKSAIFSSCTFGETANFWGTVFDSYVSFWLADFRKTVLFWEVTFNEVTDFNGAVLNQPASFMGVDFRENTVFVGLWNDILCPIVQFITMRKVKLKRRIVTDFISMDTATVMDGSSNPHLKRYIEDEQWIKSWREKSSWRKSVFFIWELTSHCGRSIGLWAAWSLFFILLFAFIYTPAPGWAPESWRKFWPTFEQTVSTYAGKPLSFWSCFYFSIVSFTTLGFGDIAAANSTARFLVTIQVTFGYVMLGGLISIFANKFARRS